MPTAPNVLTPDTDRLDKVPVLVILGCALVVTVSAVVERVEFPFKLPVNVVALILPAVILPLTLRVPLIFAPEFVITNTLLTPLTPIVTLPLGLVISTLLDPFTILSTTILPAVKLPVTERLPNTALPTAFKLPVVKKLPPVILPVAVIIPAVLILPILALPDTLNVINVPVLVILGCALVITVPAVVALETVPVTLAPAILRLDKLLPSPLIYCAPIVPVLAYTLPTVIFPAIIFPDTDNDVSVPKLVILD